MTNVPDMSLRPKRNEKKYARKLHITKIGGDKMAKYIEREALTEKIDNLEPPVFYADGNLDWYQDGFKDALKEVNKILDSQPTADVAEVKHGEWKKQKGKPEAICSECGREVVYQIVNNRWEYENYCPHCGTKMDKERK